MPMSGVAVKGRKPWPVPVGDMPLTRKSMPKFGSIGLVKFA